jgi:hypothetical protein
MPTVQLEDEEWQRLLAMLATQPWAHANPIIMKIGEQLRAQAPRPQEGNSGHERRAQAVNRADGG